jgi:hypothetical protein
MIPEKMVPRYTLIRHTAQGNVHAKFPQTKQAFARALSLLNEALDAGVCCSAWVHGGEVPFVMFTHKAPQSASCPRLLHVPRNKQLKTAFCSANSSRLSSTNWK